MTLMFILMALFLFIGVPIGASIGLSIVVMNMVTPFTTMGALRPSMKPLAARKRYMALSIMPKPMIFLIMFFCSISDVKPMPKSMIAAISYGFFSRLSSMT